MRSDSPRSLDLASLFLGAIIGLGTNLITADVATWWPPLHWLASGAAWWLPGVAVAILVWELGRRGLLRRRVTWRLEESPFPGLEAYTAERAAVFFGRDEDVRAAVKRLDGPGGTPAQRTVPIVGPSGVGKSSLLQAGLIPALAATRLVAGPIRPGADPFNGLAEALLDAAGAGSSGLADLAAELRREAETPQRTPERLLAALRQIPGRRPRRVIVVDQAEELFTGPAAGEGRLLWQYLQRLLAADRSVWLVAAVRPESLHELQQASGAPRPVPIPLDGLDSARLRTMLDRTTRAAGVTFEPGLLDQIVAEAAGGDALPLVNQLMLAIWPHAGSVIGTDAYDRVNRIEGSLTQHADRAYRAAADRHGAAHLDALLLRLAGWDGHRPTLRAAPVQELPETERAAAADLRDARLLVDANAGRSLVLVHEVLLRRWDRLAALTDAHTALLRSRGDLESTAARWAETGRGPDLLLRGGALREAGQIATRLGASPNLTDLITASDLGERRDAAGRAAAAAAAAQQMRRTDRSQAIALAHAAATQLDADPAAPAVLTLWALTTRPEVSPAAAPYADDIRALAWDGTELVTIGDAGALSRWSPDGRLLRCDLVDPGRDPVLSPDGRMLAVNEENRLALYTTAPFRLVGHRDLAYGFGTRGLGFGPDGTRHAQVAGDTLTFYASDDHASPPRSTHERPVPYGAVPIWSPTATTIALVDGSAITLFTIADSGGGITFTVPAGRVRGVAWSPDGALLATLDGSRSNLDVWRADTGEHYQRLALGDRAGVEDIVGVAWLAPPYRLVVHATIDDRRSELWFLDDAGRTVRREVVPWPSRDTGPALRSWSIGTASPVVAHPAGKIAVIGSSGAAMFDLTAERWVLLSHFDLSRRSYWSPDWSQVASVTPSGIDIIDLDDGSALALGVDSATGEQIVSCSWSPEGDRVAAAGWRGFAVLDAGALTRGVLHDVPGLDARAMTWTPDGALLLRVDRGRTTALELFDPKRGERLRTLEDTEIGRAPLVLAPDGSRLAIKEDGRGVRTVDVRDGTGAGPFGPADASVVAWSPGSTLLAIGTAAGRIDIVDPRDGTTVAQCMCGAGPIAVLAWHPHGRLLAVAVPSPRGERRVVQLWRTADGVAVAELDLPDEGHQERPDVLELRWLDGPDRLLCALGSGRVLTWRLPVDVGSALGQADGFGAPLPGAVLARYGLSA
ncbi:NACHT and WD repeat domain-containing protein [Dactylosporangium sp. CA-233914]|uniref:NACHT and WD repeat domain-containing protein n=1 Tax=Dactylosporangium sp. CA-233914 TaxID=3239934 RepID=UPI003D925AEC